MTCGANLAPGLIESSADQHDVRDFLAHANITTTSRYLRSTPLRLKKALAQLESGAVRTPFARMADSGGSDTQASAAIENEKALIR